MTVKSRCVTDPKSELKTGRLASSKAVSMNGDSVVGG